MTATFVALTISLAAGAVGQGYAQGPCPANCQVRHQHVRASAGYHPWRYPRDTPYILPDGPGDGWGFRNGNPDGYGWVNYGPYLPLGGNRTSDYYFPRYNAVPPEQMFFPTYYNPYLTRGQRYLPFTAGGGDHPAGGWPVGPAEMPIHPYASERDNKPVAPVPRFNGRVEAAPVPSGGTGLTP
jgi:hypothetical protein